MLSEKLREEGRGKQEEGSFLIWSLEKNSMHLYSYSIECPGKEHFCIGYVCRI